MSDNRTSGVSGPFRRSGATARLAKRPVRDVTYLTGGSIGENHSGSAHRKRSVEDWGELIGDNRLH
jgi:hypothetical protein